MKHEENGVTMTEDVVAAFFEDLGTRGYEPLFRKVSGTVRFDLVSGKATERWLVAIRKGNLAVSRKNVAADTTMRLSRTLFEAVVRGETNLLSALLRGEVVLEGDYRLMIMVRRVFRKRLAVPQPERAAGYARRQR
jgi:putative sterol carrier protein